MSKMTTYIPRENRYVYQDTVLVDLVPCPDVPSSAVVTILDGEIVEAHYLSDSIQIVPLSEDKVQTILAYLELAYERGLYEVCAFDTYRIYSGVMLKKNLPTDWTWCDISYNKEMAGGAYMLVAGASSPERIRAAVYEKNMRFVEWPGTVMGDELIAFSEEEFAKLPPRPNPYSTWDVVKSEWYDPRNVEEFRKSAMLEIRNKFEGTRWNRWGKYVPQFDQSTWPLQLEEAAGWLKDPTYPTPYIDTFMSLRLLKVDKRTLCQEICDNSAQFKQVMAEVSAEQWNYLDRAKVADLQTLDALLEELRSM